MPIAKDHANLPKSQPDEGQPPSPPHYGAHIAVAWGRKFVDDQEREKSGVLRCSNAGSCARQLAYVVDGVEVSNPLLLADHWRFGIGHTIHDQVQAALADYFADEFPNTSITFEVDCTLADGQISGHLDALIVDEDKRTTVLELKTINGFGFKQSIGARGTAEGPRLSALLQAALYGKAMDADEIVIVYLSTENLSPREATKIKASDVQRFAAEWRLDRDEFLPMAIAEEDRLVSIIASTKADGATAVARRIPGLPLGAVVTNPGNGQWIVADDDGKVMDTGTTWHCNYCPMQAQCVGDSVKGK